MLIRHGFGRTIPGVAAILAAAACGDGTGVATPQDVSLLFQVSSTAANLTSAAGGSSSAAAAPMILEGTNGTLTIDEIHIIINEAELKPADGSCLAVTGDQVHDDCPDFEAPPRFMDLPLDGTPVEAVTAAIPPGTYKALDFEVEDLEDDEESAEEAAAIAAVKAQILLAVPDWPDEASVLVVGSFQPVDANPISFRVFLKAEIEVELDLVPELVIAEDGSASTDLVVDVQPALWFVHGDGTVRPLHEWDWDTTGETLEFDVEMEDGFTKIEFGG